MKEEAGRKKRQEITKDRNEGRGTCTKLSLTRKPLEEKEKKW